MSGVVSVKPPAVTPSMENYVTVVENSGIMLDRSRSAQSCTTTFDQFGQSYALLQLAVNDWFGWVGRATIVGSMHYNANDQHAKAV